MIKGWRNDPRWVDYYARKKEAALKDLIDRKSAEFELDEALANADRAMRAMHRKPLKIDTY